MCSGHRSSDYMKDIFMELKSEFFPPPIIIVPEVSIPPLRDYKYDFKKENEMIIKYDVEQKKKQEAEKAKLMNDSSPMISSSSEPSLRFSSSNSPEFSLKTEPRKIDVLKPVPAPVATHANETMKTNGSTKLHGFEEFEATATVFDLMELRSIDDRKELEQLF